MARTPHPITVAAARVKAAQDKADKADRAVERFDGVIQAATMAHAQLNAARESLRALLLDGDAIETLADDSAS